MPSWSSYLPRMQPPPPVTPGLPPAQIVAHRGGLAHAPENSLEAIRGAAARRADAVELDVRMRGGELICAHDRGREGPLASEALDLALSLGLRVELDLKSTGVDGAIGRVVDLLDAAGAHERAWVSTFHPLTVWRLRWADPRVVVGWSIARSVVERAPLWSAWQTWLGVQVVEPEFALLTPERLAYWQSMSVAVVTWRIPDGEVQGCLDRGVSVVVDALE